MHHVTSLNKSNPHMKPHFNKIIISTQQKVQSGFLRQHKTHRKDHLPSRSISKTLMASCVLSGRTSLAGSVCLLWIPGETEGGDCIGLMKGCAPTTDIIRHCALLPEKSVSALSCSPSCFAGSPLSGPARTTGGFGSVFIEQIS